MKASTKIPIRTVAAAALTFALLGAAAHAQAMPGGPGAMPGSDGSSGGKHRKGAGQKTEQQDKKPGVDEKDYHSALDRLTNQPFDPWHDSR
jgi:Spy/CpxP family protein refolding chaperone